MQIKLIKTKISLKASAAGQRASRKTSVSSDCVRIPVCTPEHQYAPNQFELGHLFTQSNVP